MRNYLCNKIGVDIIHVNALFINCNKVFINPLI